MDCGKTLATSSTGSMEMEFNSNIPTTSSISFENMDYIMDMPSTSSSSQNQNKMRKRIGAVSKKSWRFSCDNCEKSYRTKGELKKHMDSHLNPTSCLVCGKIFKTTIGLEAHSKKHEKFVQCQKCGIEVARLDWGHHLRTRAHKQGNTILTDFSENVKLKSSDFMERIEVYTYTSKEICVDPEEFFKIAEEEILKILEESAAKHFNFKFNFELECLYIKDVDESVKVETISHVTKMRAITRADMLSDIYQEKIIDIKTKMSEFQERDSGWALFQISLLNININQHSIIRGSSYIKLPSEVAKLNACLNIKNKDVYCFKWCVIAALKKPKDPKLISIPSSYDIKNIASDMISVNGMLLNFKNMKFPVDLKEISIFESQNTFISINVFGFDNKGKQIVGPYRKCERVRQIHISLLLLEDDDCSQRHFILIKSLSR